MFVKGQVCRGCHTHTHTHTHSRTLAHTRQMTGGLKRCVSLDRRLRWSLPCVLKLSFVSMCVFLSMCCLSPSLYVCRHNSPSPSTVLTELIKPPPPQRPSWTTSPPVDVASVWRWPWHEKTLTVCWMLRPAHAWRWTSTSFRKTPSMTPQTPVSTDLCQYGLLQWLVCQVNKPPPQNQEDVIVIDFRQAWLGCG